MDSFEYRSNPSRVIFGPGTIQKLPDELSLLGFSQPLIVCGVAQNDQAEVLSKILASHTTATKADIFAEAQMHTPFEVTEKAIDLARSNQYDCVVSIGGGSAIGLGKAISFQTGIYHLAVPTTYAGSEMTPILGETRDGRKTTIVDHKILPGSVIYDIDFTLTLPVGLSATSGINAIAHAVEALYARNGNPITRLLALDGVRSLAEALPEILKDPKSQSARARALYGAWLCGTCLGSVGMSLHHKLCHTLGGSFQLPHAEVHTIVLPHALSYNAPNVPETMKALAEVFPESNGDAIHGLNILLQKLEVKRGLKAFGMQEEDIRKAAEIAVQSPYWNPRPVEQSVIQELIRRAWAGEEARADL